MKTKNKRFLNFYKYCVKIGALPSTGLCASFSSGELDLFKPDFESPHTSIYYWAYKGTPIWPSELTDDQKREFTPFRQTIVLLLAAMNNEL
jgi:hypothetical protein